MSAPAAGEPRPTSCSLCGLPAGRGPISRPVAGEDRVFCCLGCMNVYTILHTVMEQLLGSITTDTIALSPVPVLVIPEGSQYRPVRKIAYATNFEAGEAVAFAKLKAWKERFGAEVEIVHVTAGRPVDRERRKAAEGFLSTEFGEVVVIDHPSVADGLEAYLQGSKADLLAFFKPQRSFWKNLLHASESKDILRKANLPVLVVVGA